AEGAVVAAALRGASGLRAARAVGPLHRAGCAARPVGTPEGARAALPGGVALHRCSPLLRKRLAGDGAEGAHSGRGRRVRLGAGGVRDVAGRSAPDLTGHRDPGSAANPVIDRFDAKWEPRSGRAAGVAGPALTPDSRPE